MRRPLRTRLGLLGVVIFVAGCATSRERPLSCGCLAPNADVVFIADGSGDYRTTSTAFCEAVSAAAAPLRIETFVWSHGYRRVYLDHVDRGNHLDEGRRLASLIAAFRQSCPTRAVYVVGHSSGCAVALAAVEASPPGTVERVLLLAPAIAHDYDLRPALRSVRRSIEVFISRKDIGALGFGTGIAGTADGRRTAAAGRVGFTPIATCPGDAALYAKLQSHPWNPCLKWTGNRGRHYGTIKPDFVRAYLLPLLARSAP